MTGATKCARCGQPISGPGQYQMIGTNVYHYGCSAPLSQSVEADAVTISREAHTRFVALGGAANDLRNFTCQMTRHMPRGVARELERRVDAVFALACPEAAAMIAEWDAAQRNNGSDNPNDTESK